MNLDQRDVRYDHADGGVAVGMVCAPSGALSLPTVVLLHDAFGLSDEMISRARALAARGLTVFAADIWGERLRPTSETEIGPRIAGMVADRDGWLARVDAAHAAARALPEVDAEALVSLGYCFGGSSALEHARVGGDVRAVVAIHPGLDLLAPGWPSDRRDLRVLLCTGAADPMATAEMREDLLLELTDAGVDWELDLYSGTKHAFTSPLAGPEGRSDVVGYHPRNAARAWASTERFLDEVLAPSRRTARHN